MGFLDFNKNIVILNAPNVKIADSAMSINATPLTDLTKSVTLKISILSLNTLIQIHS